MHKKAKLQRWDQTLARREGVDLDDTIIAQFYPEETTSDHSAGRKGSACKDTGKEVKDVRNTILKVERTGDGFVFKVLEVIYR